MNNDVIQKKKSEYINFFKKLILPELYFKKCSYKNLIKIWSKSTKSEIKTYLETFKQKGALRSSLNWYRANLKNSEELIGDISIPTLILLSVSLFIDLLILPYIFLNRK